MALSLSLKICSFILAFITIASSCCQAQDAIQIVARAALCFDNKTVLSSCFSSLNPNTTAATVSNTTIHPKNSTTNSKSNTTPTSFCNGPCFGEVMLVLNCIEGILVNFQFYSPGLMQGVASIFGMACGGNTTAHMNLTATTQKDLANILQVSSNSSQQILLQGVIWLWMFLVSALLL